MKFMFNRDGLFSRIMNRIADLMILNLCFIIGCLPIITIGTSVTALYYTTMRMVKNEESSVLRDFIHSFKENLKAGIIIHLITVILGIWLAYDLYYIVHTPEVSIVMKYVFYALLICYLFLITYIYPILAKFYCPIKHTFTNAILMSIRHFPSTIIMLFITGIPVLLIMLSVQTFAFAILILALLGLSSVSYFHSFFLVRIFNNYLPEDNCTEEKKVF